VDVRYRRTDAVLEGFAPTLPLVDPWPIHIVTLIMGKIFPGVSGSGQRGVEDILPKRVPELQESKIAVSAEPFGRGLTSNL